MKTFLAILKMWIPVLAIIVACLCFEIRWYFSNGETYNCPSYVAPAIGVANFLQVFIWPHKADLPFTILFWAVVATAVFLFRKMSRTGLKRWRPILVGSVAGLVFGIWSLLQSGDGSNCPFYLVPVKWIFLSLASLVGPRNLDPPVVVLLCFIYFAGLGALAGFLFQLVVQAVRGFGRHDISKTS
jgi:hypothetical protein